ncbi:MAG: 3-oxoadipate enol-lactonase [Pseudomonadota bacterium]
MQAVTLNDQLIAYRHHTGGGGPCVVFANSLGSDQSLWDGVIAHLGGGFDTLTYDLRGHGLSAVTQDYTVVDMADDLIALIENLGLRDVILCGVSVGGMVAQSVAARRPDLLSAVILSNTAARIGSDTRWNDRIEAVANGGIDSIADTILENWFAPSYRAANPNLWALHRAMLCRTPAEGYAATSAAIRDADLSSEVGKITVPTLCVAGAEDHSVTPDQVEALAKDIPAARLEVLVGVGHLPAFEAPKEMAALIEEMAKTEASAAEQGMTTRRGVLGDAHVDRAEAAKTDFDLPFQALITEGAWGSVWSDPSISRRERSMLTLALLAATGNFEEIPMHVRATARTGANARDIQQAFQHVAIYAGVPRANHALKLARTALAKMKSESHD